MMSFLIGLLIAVELGQAPPVQPSPVAGPPDLVRMAAAVETAESSNGADRRMWRPDPAGPQGPMQVSLAAANDAGGGDRFDPAENRRLGQAYLGLMFERYHNWPDAVAAYAWGPGNFDRWVAAGRPTDGLSLKLRAYLERIMQQFGAPIAPGGVAPSAAAAPRAPAIVRLPAEPPPAQINDPALRKTHRANAAMVAELRNFLASNGAGDAASLKGVQATIRKIAARRGYEEFAPSVRQATTPTRTGLAGIATVLVGKLQAESDAIVLVDQRRQRARLQPVAARPASDKPR